MPINRLIKFVLLVAENTLICLKAILQNKDETNGINETNGSDGNFAFASAPIGPIGPIGPIYLIFCALNSLNSLTPLIIQLPLPSIALFKAFFEHCPQCFIAN